MCDDACNTRACLFDRGDCTTTTSSSQSQALGPITLFVAAPEALVVAGRANITRGLSSLLDSIVHVSRITPSSLRRDGSSTTAVVFTAVSLCDSICFTSGSQVASYLNAVVAAGEMPSVIGFTALGASSTDSGGSSQSVTSSTSTLASIVAGAVAGVVLLAVGVVVGKRALAGHRAGSASLSESPAPPEHRKRMLDELELGPVPLPERKSSRVHPETMSVASTDVQGDEPSVREAWSEGSSIRDWIAAIEHNHGDGGADSHQHASDDGTMTTEFSAPFALRCMSDERPSFQSQLHMAAVCEPVDVVEGLLANAVFAFSSPPSDPASVPSVGVAGTDLSPRVAWASPRSRDSNCDSGAAGAALSPSSGISSSAAGPALSPSSQADLSSSPRSPAALSLDSLDASGNTPLMMAAAAGRVDTVRALLARGASPRITNLEGHGAVHIACLHKHHEVVNELLAADDSLALQCTSQGATPLHVAVGVSAPDVVGMLLRHRSPVNVVDTQGSTPLMAAVRGRAVACVRLLLQANANTAMQDHRGWTALHWACAAGDRRLASLLLQYKAGIEASTHLLQTPLLLAVKEGNDDVVQLLLEHFAKRTSEDHLGRTPLDYARLAGHERLVSMLQDWTITSRNRSVVPRAAVAPAPITPGSLSPPSSASSKGSVGSAVMARPLAAHARPLPPSG